DWLDTTIGAPPPTVSAVDSIGTPTIDPKSRVIYKVEEMTPDNLRPNTVFHLHGSLLDPTGMVLTTQDYLRHYANDRRADGPEGENRVLSFLEFLFLERNVLFVGYGL